MKRIFNIKIYFRVFHRQGFGWAFRISPRGSKWTRGLSLSLFQSGSGFGIPLPKNKLSYIFASGPLTDLRLLIKRVLSLNTTPKIKIRRFSKIIKCGSKNCIDLKWDCGSKKLNQSTDRSGKLSNFNLIKILKIKLMSYLFLNRQDYIFILFILRISRV